MTGWRRWSVGATCVFQATWSAEECLRLIERERVSNAWLVPTVWRLLLEAELEAYDLFSLRKVGSAGEPLDQATLLGIRSLVCPWIVNAYGSTEAGATGTCLWNDELLGERVRSVGRPILGADVRLVLPGGSPSQPVAQGELGEVLLSGPALAREVFADELDAFVVDSELARYQRPRQYVFAQGLPRTATNKLDRRALRERSAIRGADRTAHRRRALATG